jgi:antitoxin ParD1/3/4
MQVTLTPEQQRFVEEKLKAGGFASASEVVGSALAMWKSQEELTPEDVDELRVQIQVGLEQSRRGESTPLDMAAIKEQVRRLRAAGGRKTG